MGLYFVQMPGPLALAIRLVVVEENHRGECLGRLHAVIEQWQFAAVSREGVQVGPGYRSAPSSGSPRSAKRALVDVDTFRRSRDARRGVD